jgi:hypothetical protein
VKNHSIHSLRHHFLHGEIRALNNASKTAIRFS